ncbi:MAG TPA: hypothetical protein VGE52_08870 [Pirellulales bacterium]
MTRDHAGGRPGKPPRRLHVTSSASDRCSPDARRRGGFGKRFRGGSDDRAPFGPPEDWHEPADAPRGDYRIVMQPPGKGFRHVVTPEEVRARLALLPREFLANLEVVQFSRMTRKKQRHLCYGLQWGTTVYLYPMEDDLIERYGAPPEPRFEGEARLYGGRWRQDSDGQWELAWSPSSIRDFYLNNILIHEVGHLVDDRNTNLRDRERFAEWFAVEYGYRPTLAQRRRA